MLVLYEREHGPVYYQYDSRAWTETEGALYQVGEVLEPLAPAGRVMINGEIWNAVSLGGEHIGKGERVEVISRDGLTLKVDRVAVGTAAGHPDATRANEYGGPCGWRYPSRRHRLRRNGCGPRGQTAKMPRRQ